MGEIDRVIREEGGTPTAVEKGQQELAERLRTILVVDDQEEIRRLVKDSLASEGVRVLLASNGEEALDVLADPSMEIDLLLTDFDMPGMVGTTLALKARRLRPGLKVILMSGSSDEEIMELGSLLPGLCVLRKPFRVTELRRLVPDHLVG